MASGGVGVMKVEASMNSNNGKAELGGVGGGGVEAVARPGGGGGVGVGPGVGDGMPKGFSGPPGRGGGGDRGGGFGGRGGGGGGRGGRGGMRGGGGGGRFRGGGGGPGVRPDGDNKQLPPMNNMRSQEARLNERLQAVAGSTVDLPPQDTTEKKFSGRCRLYVGNLTPDTTEDELRDLFKCYGETAELFINKEKMFAFIRLDYRANAEQAKRELDGTVRKGRTLKVRFAPHSAAIKIKNLTTWVSNELLEKAFSVFGEIERAFVLVDERGKTTGEGIVEYARRPGAMMAMKYCQEGCFFLTSALKPVIVEPMETAGDDDGYQEKNMPKKNPEYMKAREVGPRFASPGSFEYEYGQRWKQLFELRKQKEESMTREMKLDEEKLAAQMEYARYEHETEMLREQLRQREMDRERQKREWEMKERQREEQRRQDEEMMRRQQEDMQLRMQQQEEELHRRQQENNLFMQAHQLNSLLDQQEQALRSGQSSYDGGYEGMGGGGMGGGGNSLPPDPKSFMEAYDRHDRYDQGGMGPPHEMREPNMRGAVGGGGGGSGGGGRGGGGAPRGQWGRGGERPPMDEYGPNKRRRY